MTAVTLPHSQTGFRMRNRPRTSPGPLAGALATLTLMTLALALGAQYVPSETPFGPLARMFDSLAPWLLTLALCLAAATALARGRWTGAALALSALFGACSLILDHRALSLPVLPEAKADLRVIFFNALGDNAAFADRIVSAALEAEADVMVFAEAEAVYDALPRIARTHEVLTRCGFEDCPLIIASRVPNQRAWQLTLNPIWKDRYGVAELTLPGDRRLFLSVAHLAKPFFTGVAEPEWERLGAQYNWLPGPVLAVGDFNAAPWSRPMQQLLADTGYRAVRRPPGTWPAGAGGLGLPIDNALVHNGARIARLVPFGQDLNSNHRGLLIDVIVPD